MEFQWSFREILGRINAYLVSRSFRVVSKSRERAERTTMLSRKRFDFSHKPPCHVTAGFVHRARVKRMHEWNSPIDLSQCDKNVRASSLSYTLPPNNNSDVSRVHDFYPIDPNWVSSIFYIFFSSFLFRFSFPGSEVERAPERNYSFLHKSSNWISPWQRKRKIGYSGSPRNHL